MTDPRNIPVFVLCGGRGTRMGSESEIRPKPMVEIGSHPILWHIMHWYAHFGFRRFVLCLGYKSEVIRSYFLNYAAMASDCTVDLKKNKVQVHSIDHDQDWEVTLADTGEHSMTGARIALAAERYLGDDEMFAVTYGDGVTDANLTKELAFHQDGDRLGTVLGIHPPTRFGELKLDGDQVVAFDEKPEFKDNWINGGYFLFQRAFMEYLSTEQSCVLERTPLVRLAADGELGMYRHTGYWACMDTPRERDDLNRLWTSGAAPWAVAPDEQSAVRKQRRQPAG
jgi:glucose-1-phosphate cytidylyltransferase